MGEPNRTRCYYSNYIENCQAKHKLIVGNTIAILHFQPGGISGAWETQVAMWLTDERERERERPYQCSLENSTQLDPIHTLVSHLNRIARQMLF